MEYERLCLEYIPHRLDELRDAVKALKTTWETTCPDETALLALLEKMDGESVTACGRVLALRTQLAWSLSRIALDMDRGVGTPSHDAAETPAEGTVGQVGKREMVEATQ